MGILDGRQLLLTGVLTDQSIAFHVARLAQQEGARVVLTSFGRALSLTRRTATRLPSEAPVLELDVTSTADMDSLATRLGEHVDRLDGGVALDRVCARVCAGREIPDYTLGGCPDRS